MAKTAFVFHEQCLLHDTGPFHPESPKRLEAILDAFVQAELHLPRIEARTATREELEWVHIPAHIELVERCCKNRFPYPDPDITVCPQSWKAALLAAGGAIEACKAVLDGDADNVFWAMRPPGHHAEEDHAMGFCLFNNIAIAAHWLRKVGGLSRVAILDWDIHHGNGTQQAFYNDDSVFYASLHQHPHYPGTGYPHERGKNNTNLNIQLPPGCAAEQWHHVLETMVLPELEGFNPEFLLISSGFDAHRLDPLGRQLLEAEDYARMTRTVKHLAKGRIVSLLEGGYHLQALGESAVAHVRALQE